jgi:hypothetical protein
MVSVVRHMTGCVRVGVLGWWLLGLATTASAQLNGQNITGAWRHFRSEER